MSFPIGPFRRVAIGGGAKAFPPFFPTNFPFLEEYYDSRSPTVAHGANVDPWVDLSGNARDMVDDPGATVPPTLNKTSGLSPKGTQLVHWDGVGGVTGMLLHSGTLAPFPTQVRGHTFYTYADWRATGSPPAPFAGSQIWATSLFNGAPRELLNQIVGAQLINWRDNAGFHGTHAKPLGVHQLCWAFNPADGMCRFYFDGVLFETLAYLFGATANDDTFMGGSANVPLNADMGHFIWYSDYHPAATVSKFKTWANIYWGF